MVVLLACRIPNHGNTFRRFRERLHAMGGHAATPHHEKGGKGSVLYLRRQLTTIVLYCEAEKIH